MSHVIEPASEQEARSLLGSAGLPLLVDFSATWCGPCQALAPVLERFAAENLDKVRVVKLDVDSEHLRGIAAEVGIRSVPTLMVVRSGEVVAVKAGALGSAALAAFVANA